MSYIETHPLAHSTVQSIYTDWDLIDKHPAYQRNGDVWSREKKQLLIDSIINRYDIPKIYFHKFNSIQARKNERLYAVIDGRQRLEAIVGFVNGDFPLAEDFVYLQDVKVNAAGLDYNQLASKYPRIKSRFDSSSLPIVTVETDDLELIEDMFSRLNEAVPLNSAEKRGAIGGDMVDAINAIAAHDFFKKKTRVSNKRYQHKEISVRLLFLFFNAARGQIFDTKKPLLDRFVTEYRKGNGPLVKALKEDVVGVLNSLVGVFEDKDILLSSQSIIPVYVMAFSTMQREGKGSSFTRDKLTLFSDAKKKSREAAEEEKFTRVDFELLDFDRLSIQGTNDASSIRERVRILVKHVSRGQKE